MILVQYSMPSLFNFFCMNHFKFVLVKSTTSDGSINHAIFYEEDNRKDRLEKLVTHIIILVHVFLNCFKVFFMEYM